MTLRIAHVTHNAQGGAGRAALRARDACRAAGMASEVFCLSGAEPDQDVIQPKWLRDSPDAATRYQEFLFQHVQWSDIGAHRRGPGNTLVSQPYPGMDVLRLNALNSFDVLHLHWVSWTVTPPDIRRWLDAGRPLVWTMHDCWPMTGGCHYPAGCEQFRTECIACPQLHDAYSVVPNGFADKLRQYGNDPRLHLVAPSAWLAGQARTSRILGGCPVHHVENPIELDIFQPLPAAQRSALRAELGFGPHDVVLLFGNHLNDEVRKGGALLTQAVTLLLSDASRMAQWQQRGLRPAFLTFGTPFDLGSATQGCRTLAVDAVRDDAVLVDLYNCADALCFPSVEDNYPNTVLEAAACGTPCIAYATGGMADMVRPGRSGLLVPKVGRPEALAEAIHQFALHHFGDATMRSACRTDTEALNAPALIGQRLGAVYHQALGRVAAPPAPAAASAANASSARSTRTRRSASAPAPAATAQGLSASAQAIHRLATVPVGPALGEDFLRHPLNRRVALLSQSHAQEAQAWQHLAPGQIRATAPRRAGACTVALASTLHAHHAGYAGPYQFVRHLDRQRFDVQHYRTPLGEQLAGSPSAAARARTLAASLGLAGYANQPNAMLTELDLLLDCLESPCDVVHFLDGELCGWLMPRAARRLLGDRAPAVVMSLHQPPELLATMISRERLADIDLVLALCESQADFLRAYAPGTPVQVVPHGIATEFFRPDPTRPPRTGTLGGPGEPVMQLLGVGHWLRDYPMALAAVRRLGELGVACEYTIVCHNFPADVALPANARVVSGLSDDELLAAYHQADALLLPMADATANNAILEAMASGLPVYTADVGGIAEMTAGAAFLAESGDAEALALGLARGARHPEVRLAMIEAGLARAHALSWAQVARQFEDVYEHARRLQRQRQARPTPEHHV